MGNTISGQLVLVLTDGVHGWRWCKVEEPHIMDVQEVVSGVRTRVGL